MSIYKQLSYNQRIDTVKKIQFSVLGGEEILKRSVVEVTKTDTYSGNEPVIGGLFDPRMGTLEHNRNCSTCEQKNLFCPGHFGHIKLASPVFHPMFFDMIRKTLKCICFRCSRPFASMRSSPIFRNEIIRIKNIKNPKKRWDAFVLLCSNAKINKRCGDDCIEEQNNMESGCRAKQPSRYLKESPMKIIAEWKNSDETVTKEMTPNDILLIFQRITDADIELMGFNVRWNKPEWMICTVLPVPPPAVRPSIIEDNGQRREDDLTHKLSDIIKYNNQLQARIDSGKGTEDQLRVLVNLIQYHIATFMDNTIPGLPVAQQRNGRKLKSVADRLKKKEGRIRGNLNGKRVDQSARSVITPDPYISLDELGVSYRIAMNITFPEVTNEYNIEHLKTLIINGPDEWPGAKYVRLIDDGITITLKYADREKIANNLKYGDIVDRHLADGDYVLFNRQPSLHKMSMMCHKTRIMKYQTFRLPVLVTNGYNADFDGDEMNLFSSQNVQTMSELMDLAAVPYMIIAPRDAKPILEVVQDTMLGSFRITKDWTLIHDKTMANLQMVNSYFKGELPAPGNNELGFYTGKQAYSQILPPHLFIEMKNKAGDKFQIINSEVTGKGCIDKTVFHALSKGLIPVLYHDYSPFEVRRLLDNTQRLICRWLTTAGFSVGISDLVTDKNTGIKLKETISQYKGKAYSKVQEVLKGNMENKSIFTNEDFFEREILNVLNELTNKVGKIGLEDIGEKTNRMINMVKSGSKGKETNVAQIIACVGQQNVDGKRVAYGFTDRTLPHFTKYDDGPDARGFVENSFISGLSPQEVFFHAMGGREGLIDTAVKSITYDSKLLIIENNIPTVIEIGKWINDYLDNKIYKQHIIQYGTDDANMELLNINDLGINVSILSTDNYGNINWHKITNITRHDPSEYIYNITTKSGRKVSVVNSKSLLIWNKEIAQFEPIDTEDVKIGDYVPTYFNIPNTESIEDASLHRDNGFIVGTHIDSKIDKWFLASDEFIKGLIDGYISTYGYVNEYNISVSSISEDLIIGISYLLSRYGIFSTISKAELKYTLNIDSNYLYKFSEVFTLSDMKKQEELDKYKTISNISYVYKEQKDIILDEIISIEKVKSNSNNLYRKVFDITVPDTLNFCLYNGMGIRDTSETGYIQRRLVKAMEDNKIYYDQTVRNATGAIVQYLYGEDGIDGTKIENQYIPYISMNLIEIDIAYNIRPEDPLELHTTPEAFAEIGKDTKWLEKSKRYFNDILDDRMYLIKNIFKGEDNNKIQYPIPFERIIGNAMKRFNIVTKREDVTKNIQGIVPTDLTPGHIYNMIDALIDKLKIIQKHQATRFLHILLRCHLNPKTLIFEHHMPLTIFNYVISEIEKYFMQSIAHAGEMVGIIAAQSIGELSTQQSVTGDTIVKIMHNNTPFGDILYCGEIGKFIDKMMEDNPRRVHTKSDSSSSILNMLSRENYTIISVNTEEKLKWSRISQISRHNANGNIMKVITKSGREVTATLSHSFLMRNCYGIFPIRGSLLKIGDYIPIAKAIPQLIGNMDDELKKYKAPLIDADSDIIPNVHEIVVTMKSQFIRENGKYTRKNLAEIIHTIKNKADNKSLIKLLQQAIDADVIYDEIVSIEILPDPKTYVYDFTVPGTESFMVNDGIMVHNTLDSFHSSGTAAAVKATSGVPRLKELLSVSKKIKTPTLVIYMKPDISIVVNPLENDDGKVVDTRVQDSKERSMNIMKQIEITYLADILDSTEIYWDPPGNNGLGTGVNDDNSILDIYRAFSTIECQKARSQSPWVLRMKLNKVKMYRINITMLDIYTKFNTMYNQSIDCVFSDDNADELIFRIRLTKEVLKDIDPDDAIAALKAMEYNLTHNVLLKGVKGIKKVSMREKVRKQYNYDDDTFEKVSEWILDTDGTNLIEILANPNIDSVRTRSNDIYEIMQVLGIEAARNALYQEFMEVTGEDAINYRHMSLLLDTMTNRGTLMSVDRHGINRGDVGPLAKCSFEETTDMLINASIFSELDHINGVSANIMLGQLPPCGTGDHEVLIDEKMYMDLLKESSKTKMKLDIVPTSNPEIPSMYDDKPSCSVDNIALKYTLPKKTKKKMPAPNVTFI